MARKRISEDQYDEHLVNEAAKITVALGRMFAPFCEVLLHDLRHPKSSILVIENPLSGRKVGDSATSLGLARITQKDFPDVVQNYPNATPDGRLIKSTSIGIRGRSGRFVASICLNLDRTHFSEITSLIEKFVSVEGHAPVREQLRSLSVEEIQRVINQFSRSRNTEPVRLNIDARRELIGLLDEKGLLGLKNAVPIVASALSVTRPSVYNYLRAARRKTSGRNAGGRAR
jgi:predicted transcriptional regulator YheO